MRILLITSKDHPYANYLLGRLFRADVFHEAEILVGEQSALVPGKGAFIGLLQYWRTAGLSYVLTQIIKTYLFKVSRFILGITGKTCAPFYPYWKLSSIKRVSLNNVKNESTKQRIRDFKPDLIFSLLSKEILPKDIIALPPMGCINLHPALLPEYKGVSPTFWVLADKADATGVTLHSIDTGIDTGGIIAQTKISLTGIQSEHELYMRCIEEASRLVQVTLADISNIKPAPQVTQGNYRSLPTKQAIRAFRRNEYRFFSLKQFLQSGFSCKNTD